MTVRYGAVVAVDDVSLTVEPGRITGLIGPNGSGKTTLIDAVSGFARPVSGSIALNGVEINSWPVARRARSGISRSFQSLELFEDISVGENIRAAADERSFLTYFTSLVAPRNRPLSAAAVAAIEDFKLAEDLGLQPKELSYGKRRLVAVARAAAVPSTSILLLDEPAAGLDEVESRELATLIRSLADTWGIGILLVEHDVSFIMSTCDYVVALDFGRQIAAGLPTEVQSNSKVITAYLGTGDTPNPAFEGSPHLASPDSARRSRG